MPWFTILFSDWVPLAYWVSWNSVFLPHISFNVPSMVLSVTHFRYSRACPCFCLQFFLFLFFAKLSDSKFSPSTWNYFLPYSLKHPHVHTFLACRPWLQRSLTWYFTVICCTQIPWERTGGHQDLLAQHPPFHLGHIKLLNSMFFCLKILSVFLVFLTIAALLSKQVPHCQKSQPKITIPYTLGWAWAEQWPEKATLYNIWPLLQISDDMSV